jgi:hypothetical protein
MNSSEIRMKIVAFERGLVGSLERVIVLVRV